MMVTPDSAWLRRFHPDDRDLPTLLCLPHAGGSASSYFALSARLRGAVDVVAVQYPGRQDRYVEPAAVAMDELVDELVEEVRPVAAAGPYALFGHSMGALVGYELTLRLERAGDPPPRWLFASGRRAPSRLRTDDHLHARPEEELVRHVLTLGGIQPEVLADPDLRAMIVPVLRADFTVVETYRPEPGRRIGCPVSVLVGDRDPVVHREEAMAWREHTRGAFELTSFVGGHFYLTDYVPELARTVLDRFLPAAADRRRPARAGATPPGPRS